MQNLLNTTSHDQTSMVLLARSSPSFWTPVHMMIFRVIAQFLDVCARDKRHNDPRSLIHRTIVEVVVQSTQGIRGLQLVSNQVKSKKRIKVCCPMCPFLLMRVTLCKSILGRHIILQHNFIKIDGTCVLNCSGSTSIET